MHPSTRCVHAGSEPEKTTGAIFPPIFQVSTFVQQAPGEHQGFDYSRARNPTRDALETALASLEGAQHALAFASGLAAEQAIIQIFPPACKVLVCDDVYGGTGRLFRTLYAKYGFEFCFLDMSDLALVEQEATPNTALIWIETPTNPTLKIIDIAAVAAIAKKVSARLVVDNTFASPLFQQPLALGADIVVHSTTKYIGGHSDLIGGAVMTSNSALFEQLQYIQFAAGAVPAPFECFLLLRSIKTLAIRMQQHEKNARQVVHFLCNHPQVEQVFFPGLESHPNYAIARKQMTGFSGMVSFKLQGEYEQVKIFLSRLRIIQLAESLGGIESLINHPERMTHASVPAALRQKLGIGPTLLRLSVGIEEAADLIEDLRQALDGK